MMGLAFIQAMYQGQVWKSSHARMLRWTILAALACVLSLFERRRPIQPRAAAWIEVSSTPIFCSRSSSMAARQPVRKKILVRPKRYSSGLMPLRPAMIFSVA